MTTPPAKAGGFSHHADYRPHCGTKALPEPRLSPECSWPGLWSRSATYPHQGQTCVLTESDFSTTSPQFEPLPGEVQPILYTLQPALSALRQRMLTNC